MCRNIKTLFNYEPPANEKEIRDAALQFVRKISGTAKPSKVNEAAFDRTVDEISLSVSRMLDEMATTAAPKNRETEAAKAKAKARSARRFQSSTV